MTNHSPSTKTTYQEDTAQNTASGDAALEIVDLAAGLVDVERADDDELGLAGEVAHRNGHLLDQVLAYGLDVVLELGRDGYDGRLFGHRALHKLDYLLVLLLGLLLLDQVDLVLQNEDVTQLHDLDGRQVLRRLRLRTRLIASYKHAREED